MSTKGLSLRDDPALLARLLSLDTDDPALTDPDLGRERASCAAAFGCDCDCDCDEMVAAELG